MARTTINTHGVPAGTIVASDLSYPLTNFSSTGIDDNASATQITIESGGDVGIGITNPAVKLDVREESTGSEAAIQIYNTDNTNATTQSARLRLGPDTRGASVTGIEAIKENADFSTNAGRDASLVLYSMLNNSEKEAVRITSDGNVGIGTTSPSRLLTLSSSGATLLSLVSTGDDNCQVLFGDSASDTVGKVVYAHDTNHMRLETNSAERMRITSAGHVGIGTTSPATKLQVDGQTRVTDGTINIDTISAGNVGYFGTQTDHSLAIRTNDVERMRVTTAGTVGIGISSPAAVLHVKGTGDLIRCSSTNSSSGGAQIDLMHESPSPADDDLHGMINFGGYYSGTSQAYGSAIRSAWSDVSARQANLRFYTRDGSTFDEHMRIDTSGNVGIGTTSPADKLHIYAGFSGVSSNHSYTKLLIEDGSHSAIQFSTANTSEAGIMWADPQDNDVGGLLYYHASDFMYFRVNGAERVRIDSSGGLRIGTTTQIFNSIEDEKLSVKNTVNGSAANFEATNLSGGYPVIYVRDSYNDSGQHYALYFYRTNTAVGSITTTTSATHYNTSSDYRLKENVVSLDNAIDRVKQLSPYRFNFIGDAGNTVDGFLAHEVSPIVPEAVSGEHNGVDASGDPVYQGIDQSKLVPLLTKAIQELEARVAALESN